MGMGIASHQRSAGVKGRDFDQAQHTPQPHTLALGLTQFISQGSLCCLLCQARTALFLALHIELNCELPEAPPRQETYAGDIEHGKNDKTQQPAQMLKLKKEDDGSMSKARSTPRRTRLKTIG